MRLRLPNVDSIVGAAVRRIFISSKSFIINSFLRAPSARTRDKLLSRWLSGWAVFVGRAGSLVGWIGCASVVGLFS